MVYLHSCGSSIEILNLSGGTVQSVDMLYNFIVLTIKLAATKMDVKTMEEFISVKEKEAVKDILQSKFMKNNQCDSCSNMSKMAHWELPCTNRIPNCIGTTITMKNTDLPDSNGWWWCRAKTGYLPGDERCVEVSIVEDAIYPGVIVFYGRDFDYIRPQDHIADIGEWFYDMEWTKAESPWN